MTKMMIDNIALESWEVKWLLKKGSRSLGFKGRGAE
jgi:hypothetical protein